MAVTADFEAAPQAPEGNPYALDLPRALRALRKLIADKEDTRQVFEIMQSLNGGSTAKGYVKLLETPEGGRLAYKRAEVAALLSNTAWLKTLPADSVGAAYLHFTTSENISAQGLIDESRKANGLDIDVEHPYAWYGRRLRDVHDVWHVLTGYGRDALGEGCVVAFSYAQTKSTGFALIAAAAANQIKRGLPKERVWAAVWQAYRNGAKAGWLPGEDYEKLLAEPLDAARARLNIPRPDAYLAIDESVRAEAMAPMAA